MSGAAMAAGGGQVRLKTWSEREPTLANDFYILSKGDHAGRPMDQSCPNCFVVRCKNEDQRNDLYGLCLALWHAGSFRRYIRGSVIPFIIIGHAEGLLSDAYEKFLESPQEQRLHIDTLRKLDVLEKNRHNEIDLIRKLKQAFAQKHFHDAINVADMDRRSARRGLKR